MKRTDNTQLPSTEELKQIVNKEVFRALPKGKESVHYPTFDTIINLFSHYGLPTDIFTNDSLDMYQVVAQGTELINQLLPHILSKPHIELVNAVFEYLTEEDNPQKSDIIFVFGSQNSRRAPKAAELFKQGLAKKVMVSGASPHYVEEYHTSEAEIYKNQLIEDGVPSENIIVEPHAITMIDNVRRSLNLLDELNQKYASIILVNSNYSQRRGWAMFKKHTPDSIEFYRVNIVDEKFGKEMWYKKEDTLRIVLNEFIKLRGSVVYNTA